MLRSRQTPCSARPNTISLVWLLYTEKVLGSSPRSPTEAINWPKSGGAAATLGHISIITVSWRRSLRAQDKSPVPSSAKDSLRNSLSGGRHRPPRRASAACSSCFAARRGGRDSREPMVKRRMRGWPRRCPRGQPLNGQLPIRIASASAGHARVKDVGTNEPVPNILAVVLRAPARTIRRLGRRRGAHDRRVRIVVLSREHADRVRVLRASGRLAVAGQLTGEHRARTHAHDRKYTGPYQEKTPHTRPPILSADASGVGPVRLLRPSSLRLC